MKVPVKPLGSTVVVAGTLATAGLLLVSETTVAPSVAPTLMTTVPADRRATGDRRRVDVEGRQ